MRSTDEQEQTNPESFCPWCGKTHDAPEFIDVLEENQRLRDTIESQQARIEELEKRVYLAGHWSCPKCKFYLVSTNIHVPSSSFSANNEPQQCANGCGPMWRVTHEQSANTMVDRCEAQMTRIEKLEAEKKIAVFFLQALVGGKFPPEYRVFEEADKALAALQTDKEPDDG